MNLKIFLKKVWISLNALLLIPHVLLMKLHQSHKDIEKDIAKWMECLNISDASNERNNKTLNFIYLMVYYPQFRSLFYHRINLVGKILSFFYRPLTNLYIFTQNIGSGLFIQHGFATIISAKSIGKNCWINQQVTIGFVDDSSGPVIGDNVIIYAGAKILGNIKIGNNSIVGANAVVTKDVPENCTVVGIPAYIIKMDGQKVKKPL